MFQGEFAAAERKSREESSASRERALRWQQMGQDKERGVGPLETGSFPPSSAASPPTTSEHLQPHKFGPPYESEHLPRDVLNASESRSVGLRKTGSDKLVP